MKTAIYPGSFDPVTFGHLDIIKRSASLADHLIVGVLNNSSKTPLFSVDERVNMIKEVTADIPNVEVLSFSGLLVDFARKHNVQVIIRGLRAVTDFEYELAMSQANSRGPLGTHDRAGPFIDFGIKGRRGWSSAAPKPHANSFKESKLV